MLTSPACPYPTQLLQSAQTALPAVFTAPIRADIVSMVHTNMAKSALNMMTATSSKDLASEGIYTNSVDTGWINDENPLEKASRLAKEQGFQTPIDEEDAAARVLAPVFEGYAESPETWPPVFGKFLKDYRETLW